MKKGGIITHYDVHNHGALLQLTALIRVLAQMNIDAKALQFDKNYDFLGHDLKSKYEISIKSIRHYLKFLTDRGIGSTLYNYRKHKTLNRFRSQQDIIGAYYSCAGKIDIVVIGSDEVFALHTGPTPVFFGHGLPTENVISYAGSFGPTKAQDVRDLNCEAFVSSGIKQMKGITVRDMNSAKAVKELTGIDAPVVVDPVILYGFQSEIANMDRPFKKPYLLVYAYDSRMNDPEEISAIKAYAKKKGLKIVSPGFYHKWCDINIDVDPINLLGWFKHADEVITDTFHGSVMSIISGTKLAVKTRKENHLKLSNLLNEYGLSNRILTAWEQLESVMTPEIDFNIVNNEVISRRKASMYQLSQMIARCAL